MNPCPCGYYNHPEKPCTCPPGAVTRYLNKVSGPLMDRIDMHVEVTPVPFERLSGSRTGEASDKIRERVIACRQLQLERFDAEDINCNAQMSGNDLDSFCRLDRDSINLLGSAMDKLKLSARAHDHILRISRTIADLEQSDRIRARHLAEAIQYRSLDREAWAA